MVVFKFISISYKGEVRKRWKAFRVEEDHKGGCMSNFHSIRRLTNQLTFQHKIFFNNIKQTLNMMKTIYKKEEITYEFETRIGRLALCNSSCTYLRIYH